MEDNKEKIGLIIPACSDLNRGDQALVLETKEVMEKALNIKNIYMMCNNEVSQCERFGLKPFANILKHPSRATKHTSNLTYNKMLKIKWGIVASFDFIVSMLLLNKVTRKITKCFLDKKTNEAIQLYEKADAIFIKGRRIYA